MPVGLELQIKIAKTHLRVILMGVILGGQTGIQTNQMMEATFWDCFQDVLQIYFRICITNFI